MKVNWRRSCRIGVEEVVGVVSNTLGRSGCYTFSFDDHVILTNIIVFTVLGFQWGGLDECDCRGVLMKLCLCQMSHVSGEVYI